MLFLVVLIESVENNLVDCGNNNLLKKLTTAFAAGNVTFIG